MQNDHKTIFSTQEFVESWCRAFSDCEPYPVQVQGSGPPRTMHLIKSPMRYGSYRISGPRSHELWASPGWTNELSLTTVRHILGQLRTIRTRSLELQVRFDHEPLALLLSRLGLVHTRKPTVILNLDQKHERAFAHYSAIARKCVRRATRKGVVIRDAHDLQDVLEFEAIYTRLGYQKNWNFFFPTQLIMDLLKIPEICSFKVAQYEDLIIGGAVFLRDGNSVYDLIGVGDRSYKDLFPVHAVTDAGIKWACEIGAKFFNFGGWGSNETLREFKSFWGTHVEQNWLFRWENPFWTCASNLKSVARALKPYARSDSSLVKAPRPSNNDRNYGATWAEKALMGELRGALDPNATEVTNIVHGASLVGAKKALSLMRTRETSRSKVLDFGCGTGRMVRFFAKRGCSVIGADITLEMLEATKAYGLPPNCLLALFDGVSLPLSDHSIDIIWVCGVLKHTLFPPGSLCVHGHLRSDLPPCRFMPSCSKVAKEMYRVLKPGGIVANFEMWINEPPEVFIPSFEQAGFITEQVRLLRRANDGLESFYKRPGSRMIPPFFAAAILANYRYYFDDPHRAGFRDYFIAWRKPREETRDRQFELKVLSLSGSGAQHSTNHGEV